jgi:hypothetical protein
MLGWEFDFASFYGDRNGDFDFASANSLCICFLLSDNDLEGRAHRLAVTKNDGKFTGY